VCFGFRLGILGVMFHFHDVTMLHKLQKWPILVTAFSEQISAGVNLATFIKLHDVNKC